LKTRSRVMATTVKLGFHVSISGAIDRSVDRAKELGCDTFQMFTRNPRSWKFGALENEEVEAFKEKRRDSGIDPVFAHMPYIENLASPNEEIYERSIDSLSAEVERCRVLQVPYLVTHLGSHLGSGDDKGIARVIKAINITHERSDECVTILIENSSGSGGNIGSSFEQLKQILEGIGNVQCTGVCFDTCHAFAAGYELKTLEGLTGTLESFEDLIGFDRLKLVHLNDSVGGLGTRIDHHEHIGLGEIGDEGFRFILHSRLSRVPMIMETPVDDRRSDLDNMMKARRLAVS